MKPFGINDAGLINLRPSGGFGLIMADPPWLYKNWSDKGTEKNAMSHYDCQSIDWIKSIPVSAVASKNCLLWLWATNPMLDVAMDVMDAWGFRFTTAGHWVKRTKHNKLFFGTGYVLRSAGEPFLIGKIGKPKIEAKNVRSVIEAKVREHSRKPDEAFAAAESLLPDAHKLELFSRSTRDGWSVWGDEVGKLDV